MAGLAQLAADLFILFIPKFAQIQANISAIGHSLSSCQVSITVPSGKGRSNHYALHLLLFLFLAFDQLNSG